MSNFSLRAVPSAVIAGEATNTTGKWIPVRERPIIASIGERLRGEAAVTGWGLVLQTHVRHHIRAAVANVVGVAWKR
jgi:hypothetical protein